MTILKQTNQIWSTVQEFFDTTQDPSKASNSHFIGVQCVPFLIPKSGEFEHVLTCSDDPEAIEKLDNYLIVGNAFKIFPKSQKKEIKPISDGKNEKVKK